ncbi:MAG: glycosyltransferase family 4 protein [Gemmatimonadales bacterium]
MRIALVTDTYLPEVNGVTTVLATMRDGLRRRGHVVQVIAPEYDRPGPDESDVVRRPSIAFPPYPAIRLSRPWGGDVSRALSRSRPEVIHVATEGPIGRLGRRYAVDTAVPLVTSFHTDFPRYAGRYLGHWAVEPTRNYLRAFHRPALVTQTPSSATRDELLAMGIPQAVVWGHGVDTTLFTPARRSDQRRAELGAAGRMLVLHVGRLSKEKDTATLVESFRRAEAVLGDAATFCVAGDGPEAAAVRNALPRANHLGFIDRVVLADLYADADLFVFPSPTETCGLVALEAMAAGVPVIGAAAGGIIENVRHGINGLVVAPGNALEFAGAITALATDPARRGAMSAAARAFAVARDWERELDRLEPMYREAVAVAAA